MVDDMCFIRSMNTEAINHEPAISYMQTGNQITGRPCLGSWASYGLGSMNDNLPTFVVLVAKPTNTEQVQAISARLWSSGYLPGEHAGVSFRSGGDPILYINNPPGVSTDVRRNTLDGLQALNEMNYQLVRRSRNAHADPAIRTGLPHAIERARTDRPRQRAGIDLRAVRRRQPRSRARFAHTVLSGAADGRARRALRADLSSTTGTTTATSPAGCPTSARTSIKPCYGLIQDLKAPRTARRDADHLGRRVRPHDLLAGRTVEGQLRPRPSSALLHDVDGRRRHQRRARSTARPTISRYNIVRDPVHIRDFHATVLQLLGFDHERFTYRYQGLDQRLTGVEPARVIRELLA